jgi:hypothetical protein
VIHYHGGPITPESCAHRVWRGVTHVAYQLDEVDLANLAHGATLWLSTWGGLPIHLVEVVPDDSGGIT